MTWKEYETGLENRLADLHSRVHRGAYRAQASRRVYIPKADGRQRPLTRLLESAPHIAHRPIDQPDAIQISKSAFCCKLSLMAIVNRGRMWNWQVNEREADGCINHDFFGAIYQV